MGPNPNFTLGSHIGSDVIDGGAGSDVLTLRTDSTYNFSNATFQSTGGGSSIETLSLFNALGNTQNIIFNASQFGGSGISTNLRIFGGDGTETVTINNAGNFSASGFLFSLWNSSKRIVINGTTGSDNLTGSIQPDTINGGNGGDALNGSDGADVMNGEQGDDRFIYSSQEQINSDQINGGIGFDILATTSGSLTYDFSSVFFALTFGEKSIEQLDIQNSSTQNIIFDASQFGSSAIATNLTISAGAGTDTLTINNALAFSGRDFGFTGGWGGADVIVFNGTTGDDQITGTSQIDTLNGGDGDDTLDGGRGTRADALNGGIGRDTANYQFATVGLTARLDTAGANTGDALGDTFTSIEDLIGSDFADVLVGDGNGNTLSGIGGIDLIYGLGGADTLNGGASNDTLDGGAGADALNGEGGRDTATYQFATAGLTARLDTAGANTGDALGDTFTSIEDLIPSPVD
jgi:Ca2+-binding RTX toxin-like protein